MPSEFERPLGCGTCASWRRDQVMEGVCEMIQEMQVSFTEASFYGGLQHDHNLRHAEGAGSKLTAEVQSRS